MANKEVITKWVEALESGEFKQTHGRLKGVDRAHGTDAFGHCCLGVLCELAAAEGVIAPSETYEIDSIVTGEPLKYWAFGTHEARLPNEVVDWAGIPSSDPFLTSRESSARREASVWNDSHQKSFNDIADMVRHTFLEDDDA